jgi:microcystin degradation protein MlrC
MAAFVDRLNRAEHEAGILSVSLVHGFPWGDTYDTGTKVLVIADGDRGLASQRAADLGREFYDLRDRLRPNLPTIDEALDRAETLNGLVVLAELGDNPGGGAPGDNTSLLRAVMERGLRNAALGSFYDPMVAQVCADAGEGSTLEVRLGGKCGRASGQPVDLRVRVQAVRGAFQQTGFPGTKMEMGLTVWLEADGLNVVVNSIRNQVFHPDAFTGLGIKLSELRYIGIKSSQHFRAGFDPVAAHTIRIATPGALNLDYASIPYIKRRSDPYYPRVYAPFE